MQSKIYAHLVRSIGVLLVFKFGREVIIHLLISGGLRANNNANLVLQRRLSESLSTKLPNFGNLHSEHAPLSV